jgi:RNA polymerase sigma-70 factor (ECF subfamily)
MDADAQLMLEFQRGDRKAFEALFRRHARAMLNFAYRYVNNRAAAEELAQDIFCKVFEAAGTYHPSARFTTWLYRIATNHCLNEVRKGRYQIREVSLETGGRSGEGEDAALVLPSGGPHPEEQAAQNELEKDLHGGLQELPENQRLALLLLLESGQSYEEIAVSLTTTVSAVKSLLVRARTALKTKLKGHLEDDHALNS